MPHSYLTKLLKKLDRNESPNPLVCCLEELSHQTNSLIPWEKVENTKLLTLSNIHNYQTELGLHIFQTQIPSLTEFENSLLPILIETKEGELIVTKKRKSKLYFYNPFSKLFINLNPLYSTISRCWQFTSTNYAIPTNYFQIIQFLRKFYLRELLTITMVSLLVSSLALLPTIISGYILSHIVDINHLGSMFMVFTLAVIAFSALVLIKEFAAKCFNTRVIMNIVLSLWRHILRETSESVVPTNSGDIVGHLLNYEQTIKNILPTTLTILFELGALFFLFC